MQLVSVDGKESVMIDEAYSISDLPVQPMKNINQMAKEWKHLRGINFVEPQGEEVTILLGCDVPEAHWVFDQRISGRKQPYAIRTLFGWILCGPLKDRYNTQTSINLFCCDVHSLSNHIKLIYNHEFGDTLDMSEAYSIQEKKALSIISEGTSYNNGHFVIPLPWKNRSTVIPVNLSLAHKRLNYLRGRFHRDGNLFDKYKGVIQRHIDKGYIERVFDNPLTPNISPLWYLPHHAVFNPRKPDKIRVVFDCAAKYMNVSLNDCLLQGPNLTTQLIQVLIRFRQETMAILADIQEMFLQVHVPEEHRDALRILWWPEHDLKNIPVEYRMTVHPFGAVSSLFCANYALQRTASDFRYLVLPQVKDAVNSNFYVDDYLDSLPDIQTATLYVKQLSELLSKGGFHLTKLLSNRREVLSCVPEEEITSGMRKMDNNTLPLERTLGIQWNAYSDEFIFQFRLCDKPATRRGILSTISTLYDPLDLIAPWLLPEKLLLQELCRKRLGWDEPLDKQDQTKWNEWITDLQEIGEIQIPRCIKKDNFQEEYVELHLFCDASEVGYGAVAYASLCNNNGERRQTLLFSKSRVAPLKTVFVPRLELSAAVLAVRIFQIISTSMNIEFQNVTFWTDSTIVLYYINNISKRFNTFVANRLTIIHDASTPEQWMHVTSCENPADKSSRGLRGTELIKSWLQGPAFLNLPSSAWPSMLIPNGKIDGIEIRRKTTQLYLSTEDNVIQQLCDRYSSWVKLLRAITWLRRFKNYCMIMFAHRKNICLNVGQITVDEMLLSELDVLRITQADAFAPELMNAMQAEGSKGNKVLRTSNLRKLRPILIDGTLRVRGRLNAACLDFNAKYPIILPKNHHITVLIIQHYHISEGHAGIFQLLTIIRQKFWIIHGIAAIKRVIGMCMFCRRQNILAGKQLMAPLPSVRVQPGWYPFSHVCLDYFGPYEVKRGRSIEKRYGCLLTCLQSRALHIEMAHTMSTDSFIMILIRFIGRRGVPTDLYSDNGTNFVGADRELREWIDGLSHDTIHRKMLSKGIRWHFNPPYPSHRGGVWERLIKSMRRTLTAICVELTLNDEILETAFVEVERILNNRPIVPLISNDTNQIALTPNDLLLLRNNTGLEFKESVISRYTTQWRRANYIVDVFWKRWITEYLPTLLNRQKWIYKERNFKKGDIVLIITDAIPRNEWLLGVITECTTDEDGLVRTVEIKTYSGVIKRDIRRICLLEGDDKKQETIEQYTEANDVRISTSESRSLGLGVERSD